MSHRRSGNFCYHISMRFMDFGLVRGMSGRRRRLVLDMSGRRRRVMSSLDALAETPATTESEASADTTRPCDQTNKNTDISNKISYYEGHTSPSTPSPGSNSSIRNDHLSDFMVEEPPPPQEWLISTRQNLNEALGFSRNYTSGLEKQMMAGILVMKRMPKGSSIRKGFGIWLRDPARHAVVAAKLLELDKRGGRG